MLRIKAKLFCNKIYLETFFLTGNFPIAIWYWHFTLPPCPGSIFFHFCHTGVDVIMSEILLSSPPLYLGWNLKKKMNLPKISINVYLLLHLTASNEKLFLFFLILNQSLSSNITHFLYKFKFWNKEKQNLRSKPLF